LISRKFKILLFTVYCCSFLFAQMETQKEEKNFWSKKSISTVGIASIYAVSIYEAYTMWWADDARSFHFFKYEHDLFEDPWHLGMDKVGHFYTSYFFYHLQKDVLRWGGFSKSYSKYLSAILSGSFALLIEVGDAFSPYGFDYKDLIFNLAGIGYGFLQDEYPWLQNFNFKWSYIPDNGFSGLGNFSDQYYDQIYWLTFDVHNIIGESEHNFWPEFLNLAIGYSISQSHPRRREFTFGLDLNIKEIFKTESPDWKLLRNTADRIHVPMPGIKTTSGQKPEYKAILLR